MHCAALTVVVSVKATRDIDYFFRNGNRVEQTNFIFAEMSPCKCGIVRIVALKKLSAKSLRPQRIKGVV